MKGAMGWIMGEKDALLEISLQNVIIFAKQYYSKSIIFTNIKFLMLHV